MADVLAEVTAAVVDELFVLATHAGVEEYAALKVIVQAVTVPVPTVTVPFVSVPETLGVVPHADMVGAEAELPR